MSEPFLSEIRLMSFIFAPKGWALCNGQMLPINQNQGLFSLLGTTYGGNGQTTFALPDLRGRSALGMGSGFLLGQKGGEAAHTVTQAEMPQHTHLANASATNGDTQAPAAHLLARTTNNIYTQLAAPGAMRQQSVTPVGGSQPHNNLQPYEVISFCIALQGIFPSRN